MTDTEKGVSAGALAALTAAVRCAKLAMFVIRKQGVMPNSSWERGFDADLKLAEEGLAALRASMPEREAIARVVHHNVSGHVHPQTARQISERVSDAILALANQPAPERTPQPSTAPSENENG